MYVLVKQEPRAETVDTILFYASNSHEALEEILLSLFDELYAHELAWADREGYEDTKSLLSWCINRMDCYKIINIAYLED